MKVRPGQLLLVVSLTLLAGCGGTDALPAAALETPPTTGQLGTVAPATGSTLIGHGYRLRVPLGWHDVTARLTDPSGVDRAASAGKAVGGFTSNLNVVLTDTVVTRAHLDAVVDQIRTRMTVSAPGYAVLPDTTIDGVVSGHLGGLRSTAAQPDRPYWLEQYVVPRGQRLYLVNFSLSAQVPPAQRRQLIDSVLATWAWR